jgi:squalene-hopene/tetraprenyl-beta-curcumene cyclase
MAGTMEETLDDGTKVSRLRAYGSMTYAGFKSYLYADLPRDDRRVTAALDWISRHYTVAENPGMGRQGLYYYYVTFSRALGAWGQPRLDVTTAEGKSEQRDWANDLIDQLASLQNEDGSFRSVEKRWMEDDPVLITAYALIALREAGR